MHTYIAHATVDLSRHFQPRVDSLTSQSRGRGSWDCVRQMQLFRRRPDVLAAALRDMGVLPEEHYEGEPQEEEDHSQN